jgi:hypothetical protein
MILSVIIYLLLLLFSSSILSFDDYLENLSINTGETATFICDLPERYSNKPVSFRFFFHVIYHLKTKYNKI